MSIKVTTDYSGRQVDLEILQSVSNPESTTRVFPAITMRTASGNTIPKMVTGVEKAIQRYFVLLTTDIGSVHFDEDRGGELVTRILSGSVGSSATLTNLFAFASSSALQEIRRDNNDELFGTVPPDERISSAELVSWDIDYATSTVKLNVNISMESGDSYNFILPVTSGLQ